MREKHNYTEPKARKQYVCNACEVIRDHENSKWWDPTDEQKALWEKIKSEGMTIKEGEKYLKFVTMDGESITTFRARPDAHQLANDFGLFDGDW